jgi:acyl-CoA thioesterase-1
MLGRSWRCLGGVSVIVSGCLVLIGCGVDGAPQAVVSVVDRATDADVAAQSTQDRGPLLVALGDSLTAGLGLDPAQAYPVLLEQQLRNEGFDLTVVNAGVSGDTTAAGLRRAEWSLDGDVRFLIVALGGNDGLRGLPVDQMKQNLSAILSLAKSRDIAVLLAGMEAPPNFGSIYTTQFRDVFQELAVEHDVTFLPFLLVGVAGAQGLNQADGIHPNAAGARIVATRVREALEPLLPVGDMVTK